MTAEECAELLGVSVKTIRKYCRDGSLPAIRDMSDPTHSYEIHERDFMVFCEEQLSAKNWRQINRAGKRSKLDEAPQRPLTIDESRGYLGLSYSTIRTYCQKGLIRAQKVKRQWMISHQAIREYLALNRRPGNPNWKKVR